MHALTADMQNQTVKTIKTQVQMKFDYLSCLSSIASH